MEKARNTVFITVDTEHSIGGAFANRRLKPVGNEKRIFGRIGAESYGIPLIMDIADRHGLPVTFFVETLNAHYFGRQETRKVCDYIVDRGHDVQLHIHPNYRSFTIQDPQEQPFSDLIGQYTFEEQLDMIREATEILISNGVPQPKAFRAGCFGANNLTLKALAATGFLVDSSYNMPYLGSTCLFKESGINDVQNLDGIWELPVTNFIECTGIRARRYIPLDINGAGSGEIKSVLKQTRINGPRVITIILHSFSFIKPYDVQYNKAKPRVHVIKRFEALCRFLQENSEDFGVRSLGSLKREELDKMAKQSVHVWHKVPARFSLIRGLQQLKDNVF